MRRTTAKHLSLTHAHRQYVRAVESARLATGQDRLECLRRAASAREALVRAQRAVTGGS